MWMGTIQRKEWFVLIFCILKWGIVGAIPAQAQEQNDQRGLWIIQGVVQTTDFRRVPQARVELRDQESH